MDESPETEEAPKAESEDLIPAKSKKLYEYAYTNFLHWQKKNKTINSFTEETLLMYFENLSKKYKSSSLWSTYSKLKSMINVNHSINLESFKKLRGFLKRCSEGYKARKSEVFTGEEIDEFIKKADDDTYLATKVVAIMGIVGACRACELRSLKTQDVTFFETSLIVTIPETISRNISRRFTIFGNFFNIVKEYASLRPTNIAIDNFFIKYVNGRCYSQPMGVNTFAAMGNVIARYLGLPNPSKYTGHCFRRSSANLYIDGGGNIAGCKRRNLNPNEDLSEYSIDDAKKNKVDTVETICIENSNSSSDNLSDLNDGETHDLVVLDIDPYNLDDCPDKTSDSNVLTNTFSVINTSSIKNNFGTVNNSVNNRHARLTTEKANSGHSGSAVDGFQSQYVKSLSRVTVREEDVVRLTLEFLNNRQLHVSQLSLERETGVINGNYSDDVLFLRQLILDGQWNDVLQFIQQLEGIESFQMRKFTYTILKYKYIELLWIKSEANLQENSVKEVGKVLHELEIYSPTKQDYLNLSLLSTLPSLTDHLEYKDWNPSNARVQCFQEVYPLVVDFLPNDECKTTESTNSNNQTAQNDRLIQLLIKGLLYESCVNYCQSKAMVSTSSGVQTAHQTGMRFSGLLDGSVGFNNSDSCLLSWLQSVPSETFLVPFEQKTLNVDVERLERPTLETVWTEHMVATPIKPKTFPHSVTPFKRVRSAAHIVARTLMPRENRLVENKEQGSIQEQRTKSKSLERKVSNASTAELKDREPLTCARSSLNEDKSVEASIVQTMDVQCLDHNKQLKTPNDQVNDASSSDSVSAANTTTFDQQSCDPGGLQDRPYDSVSRFEMPELHWRLN